MTSRRSVDREDVRRQIGFALQNELMQGHCYALMHTICQAASRKLRISRDVVEEHAREMDEFYVFDRYITLAELDNAEEVVAERVAQLLKVQNDLVSRAFRSGPNDEIQLDKQQDRAIDLMNASAIGLVTGPPGSGKTTIIQFVLKEFHARGVLYALAAPTGKAAIRLQETSNRPAFTIHRLLQWTPFGFVHNENNPLPHEAILVDESSMIDIKLCADLLRATDPDRTRIIFIGDADQLPPVGPGAPFRDLIASSKVPTIYLDTVHRAAKKSWIYRNAPSILKGEGIELEDTDDFEFHEMETEDGDCLGEAALGIVNSLLSKGFDAEEFQVLSPMRKREGGTLLLNRYLQGQLNPDSLGMQLKDDVFVSEGDPVIQVKNDYDLSVMNGEVGKVDSISQGERSLVVRFPDQPEPRYLRYKGTRDYRNLELAYALTVHKFQGSQIPIVIFLCHSIHRFMLSRQLLYTALTRARKCVYLVGDAAGVRHALRTIRDTQRKTRLLEKLLSRI